MKRDGDGMNIDEMTIGEAKEIVRVFGNGGVSRDAPDSDPMIGEYCVYRGYRSGVYAGKFLGARVIGSVTFLEIEDARRLQYQKYKGFTLCSVSEQGVADGSKLSPPVKLFRLSAADISEQFVCSESAADNLKGHPNGVS